MRPEVVVLGPWLHPMIEVHGSKYVIDLKLGHFRELASPYEAIAFDSDRGRELCVAIGLVSCRQCGTTAITAENNIGLRCVKCGSMTDNNREEQPEEEALAAFPVEVEA